MVGRFYSRKRAGSTRRISLLLLASICACGGAPPTPPQEPAAPVEAEIQKAQDQEQRRDYIKAREHYERAVSLAADSTSLAYAHLEFASALVFWGEYEDAMSELSSSLKADPQQVQAWHDLGVLQARAGASGAALDSLTKAVSLDPREPRSRIALGALLVQMRRFPAAQEQYRELLTLKIPDSLRSATHRALEILEMESRIDQEERAKAVPVAP